MITKGLSLLSLLLLSTQFCLSQSILTAANFGKIGISYPKLSVSTSSNFSEGNGGAGIVWDFSNVNYATTTGFSVTFFDSSQNYYSREFPGVDIVRLNYLEYKDYMDQQGNKFYRMGIEKDNWGLVKYDTPYLEIEYPFTFNSQVVDTFHGTSNYSGTDYPRFGTWSQTCDAYGTVSTPFGVFTDALRIKTEYEYHDTISPTIILDKTYLIYTWMHEDYYTPLFQILYESADSAGQTIFRKNGYVFDLVTVSGTGNIFADHPISVFPNPVTENYVYVAGVPENEDMELFLIDQLGRRSRLTATGGRGQHRLELQGLSPGVYILQGKTGSSTFQRKLVLR